MQSEGFFLFSKSTSHVPAFPSQLSISRRMLLEDMVHKIVSSLLIRGKRKCSHLGFISHLCSPWSCPSREQLCSLSPPVASLTRWLEGVAAALLPARRRNRLQRLFLLETHCVLIVGLLIKISLCLPTFL